MAKNKCSKPRQMTIRFSDLDQSSKFIAKLKSSFKQCSFTPNREVIVIKVPSDLVEGVRDLAYEFEVRSLSIY